MQSSAILFLIFLGASCAQEETNATLVPEESTQEDSFGLFIMPSSSNESDIAPSQEDDFSNIFNTIVNTTSLDSPDVPAKKETLLFLRK